MDPTHTTTDSLITSAPLPPPFDTPESFNQLNTILSYYALPNILPDLPHEEKLERMVGILRSEYFETREGGGMATEGGREGGRDDATALTRLLASTEETLTRLRHIKDTTTLEAECDAKEIELANMRISATHKYGGKSVEELQGALAHLRMLRGLHGEYEANLELIRRIINLDETAIKALSFMKDELRGAYMKRRVEKALDRPEEWAKVLKRVVEGGECRVEELREDLEMDRVSLLRIIYNFSAKGILEYDRLEDSVRLR